MWVPYQYRLPSGIHVSKFWMMLINEILMEGKCITQVQILESDVTKISLT